MKKIFALVLSLCMVLSTFVAVSAQEQVYNEGTSFDEWSSSANSDTDGLYYGTYNNQITAGVATVEGRTGVHKMTANVDGTTAGGIFYMPLRNENGDLIQGAALPKIGTLTFSVDVMAPEADKVSSAVVTMRGGNADLSNPTAADEKVIKKDFGLVSNEWKTISGAVDLATTTYAGSSAAVYVVLRGNISAAGAELYADNFTWSISVKEYLGDVHVRTSASDIIGGTDFVVTTAKDPEGSGKDVIKASGKLNGAYSVVGTPLKDLNGNYVRTLNKGDVIRWNIRMYSTVGYSIVNPGNATPGVMFRKGNWTKSGDAGPANGSHYNLAFAQTIPANQWVTIKGAAVLDDTIKGVLDYTSNNSNNLNVFLRAAWGSAGDIYFENFDITVEKPFDGNVVEEGWGTPSYVIPSSSGKGWASKGTFADGTFTATFADIKAQDAGNNGNNVGWLGWASITPNAPISKNKDFKVNFDIDLNGFIQANGSPYPYMNVKARFYDAAGNSIGATPPIPATAGEGNYVPITISTKDGLTAIGSETVTMKLSDLSADVAKVGIVISFTSAVRANLSPDTATVRISNMSLDLDTTWLELIPAKTANGIDLTIKNDTNNEYKFAGRLLVAEYATVEDVKELVQFAEVSIDEEIEADSEEVITAAFEEDITEGNEVYVFVWEPASMDPITMFVK